MPLPAWLASIVHVPVAVKVTVASVIVHTAVLAGSMVNATVSGPRFFELMRYHIDIGQALMRAFPQGERQK